MSTNRFQVTPATCLHTTIMLTEAIESLQKTADVKASHQLQTYLVAMLLPMIENGYDPRPALYVILRSIEHCDQQLLDEIHVNYVLISLAQLLHVISPFYMIDALRLVKVQRF